MCRRESENETVGVGGSLADIDDEAEPRKVAELTKEAVPGAVVGETASEALTGEAEGEEIEERDSDAAGEPVAQVLPLTLFRLLRLVDAHAETLDRCDTVGEVVGVGEEASVDWGDALSLGEEEVHGELLWLSASPIEGEASADAEARCVKLIEVVAVDAVDALAERLPDADPKGEAEVDMVAVAALEALAGEAEDERVEDCEGEEAGEAVAQVLLLPLPLLLPLSALLVEAPGDAVAQELPLPLLRLLLLAAALAEADEHCDASEAAGVGEDVRDVKALREALGEGDRGPKTTVSMRGTAAA